MWGGGVRAGEGGVGDGEICGHVFREQFDSGTITVFVRLCQILHRLDQHLLTFDIAAVGSALTFFSAQVGRHRNRKNFAHENSQESNSSISSTHSLYSVLLRVHANRRVCPSFTYPCGYTLPV